MSNLESGTYLISSKLTGTRVGRHLVEDRSLLPKRVYVLPPGADAPQWQIENLENGNYQLKNRGSPTTVIDGGLYTTLTSELSATEWKIEPQARHGENTYTITVATGSGEGWITPEATDEQIIVQPLIVGQSFPPLYPPNELFVITRFD